LDYQKYFKEIKASGEIQTDLSLRKFTSNMKWINKYSYIAPSYQVNWKALNVAVIACKLRFNPLIKKSDVDLTIENLPFFVFSKSSESNFSIEVAGWFVVPHIYLEDLKIYLEKLDQHGYIVDMTCFLIDIMENFLNLNYFREFYKKKRFINPNHTNYDERYEIQFKFEYGRKFVEQKCSILDFLILERIRYWSITGFSFERRTETLRSLKSDLMNEIISQRTVINTLRENLELIHNIKGLPEQLLNLLKNNKTRGFFHIIEFLSNIKICFYLIKSILEDNPSIKTEYNLIEYINNYGISKNLNENIIYGKKEIRKFINQELSSLVFQKKRRFNDTVEKFQTLSNFFNSCSDLKIFNLDSIKKIVYDKDLVEDIYDNKLRKLRKAYESYKNRKITSKDIDDLLDEYIKRKPPLIKPLLISTFSTNNFAPYYLHLLVKNSTNAKKVLHDIKKYFPRVTMNYGIDLFTNVELIQIEIYLPNIIEGEKFQLISIIFNLFKEELISIRRYFYDGFLPAYSRRDFYDFDKQTFFYTKDLFIQYFQYCKQLFSSKINKFQEAIENSSNMIMSKENDMNALVKHLDDRISRENVDFNINNLKELSNFYYNMDKILLDSKELNKQRKMAFFNQFIRSIKFKPSLKHFGFDTFFLYLRPIDIKETDMKLLLSNTFQKIKHPAFIDNAMSYLIKYIFPQENPNIAHLNYIVKAKRIVSEYCLFKIRRIFQILHLDRNLDSNG